MSRMLTRTAVPEGPRTRKRLHPFRVATFLAPHLLWFYEFVVNYVSRQLGRPVELVEGVSYEELQDVDFAFVCSLPYVEPEDILEPLAAPVLSGERYGGEPIYFSDVIVAADSDLRTFADLRGRSWAYNEKHSQSGYGIARDHLVRLGETAGFFGSIVEAGWHEEAIRMVAAGEVDASAIDSQVLGTYLHQRSPLARRLRVIASLGPSPIQPLVASRRLPLRAKRDFQAALVQLHEDPWARPLLARAMVDRFVPVNAATYDPIRAMVAAARAANFLDLR